MEKTYEQRVAAEAEFNKLVEYLRKRHLDEDDTAESVESAPVKPVFTKPNHDQQYYNEQYRELQEDTKVRRLYGY